MKTVAFTQRVEIIENYNERRDCADQRISDFIYSCGYLPVPIPNNSYIVGELIKLINPAGIILTGGNSLLKYGGDAPDRDAVDGELLRIAVEKNIPVYGFCRGMQSILDYYGNKLVNVNEHVAKRHFIYGDEGKYEVNTYHNQACMELTNEQLKVVMRSEDGVIEMIRHSFLPIIGTMWHPERENPYDSKDINRIVYLFK